VVELPDSALPQFGFGVCHRDVFDAAVEALGLKITPAQPA
jgi:hypothetical protein